MRGGRAETVRVYEGADGQYVAPYGQQRRELYAQLMRRNRDQNREREEEESKEDTQAALREHFEVEYRTKRSELEQEELGQRGERLSELVTKG